MELEGRVPFSTHLITVLTRVSLINDNYQMPSCGRMTSGSLADTPGNSANDFGDGSGCVRLLSLLSGLHYPLQHPFTLSSNSLLILILWNLDTFIQIRPMPFMASTCFHQLLFTFNMFSPATFHRELWMHSTASLCSQRQLKWEGFCHLAKSSLALNQITFSKMTTFGAPFEITLYKEKMPQWLHMLWIWNQYSVLY